MINNKQLAEFAYLTHVNKWRYVLGSFGNKATSYFINDRCNAYSWNAAQRAKGRITSGDFIVCDCYGIQKAANWGNDKGQGFYARNGQPDYNINADFYNSKNKGVIGTIPPVIGTQVVLMEQNGEVTHVGFVVDCSAASYKDWYVCDMNGATMNTRLAKIKDVGYWTHWNQSSFINYTDKTTKSVLPLNAQNNAITSEEVRKVQITPQGVKNAVETPQRASTPTLEQLASLPYTILDDGEFYVVKFKKSNSLKVGDVVRIKTGAVWTNGFLVPPYVLKNAYPIVQVKGNNVLLGGVYSWIDSRSVYK